MKKNLLFIMFLLTSTLFSQTNQTFFLGHSLVNFHIPNMVNKLSIDGSKTFSYKLNIGIGANLLTHWNSPHSGQAHWWDTTLNKPGFENFIITEAVPLLNHLQWSSTYRIADSLYRFAQIQNPNIQYYIYETWHCTTTGTVGGCPYDNDDALTWRPRLSSDLKKWEGIADSLNLIHPKQTLIIPAGQAMAQLFDSISVGSVPGITSMSELFLDDIHLTNSGNYFIACLMYGVIHKTSPEGLANQLTDEWGTLYSTFPTTIQAAIFQRIAWRTLCDYARDGVSCGITNIPEGEILKVSIYPNPINDQVKIIVHSKETIKQVMLYDVQGNEVIAEGNFDAGFINFSFLNKGMYFLKITLSNDSIILRRVIK